MTAIVGIDFDNTIVSYDELLYRAARDRGLIPESADRSKRAIRDRIRQRPNGEIEWQKLQALIYGPMMAGARPTDGVEEFIGWCARTGQLFIISHKTEFASYDDTTTNLRTAALEWMDAHRFFDAHGLGGLGLRREAVFFESTRADKIARIASIGCSHFIDDLEEVFLEPEFPPSVQKILYAPNPAALSASGTTVVHNWRVLRDHLAHWCA